MSEWHEQQRHDNPRQMAPWQPQMKTVELLNKVKAVLVEYEAYLPLTVRQTFYRLVGAWGYDKTATGPRQKSRGIHWQGAGRWTFAPRISACL